MTGGQPQPHPQGGALGPGGCCTLGTHLPPLHTSAEVFSTSSLGLSSASYLNSHRQQSHDL